MIIKKSDLLQKPCHRYNDLPDEFDPIEEIKKRGNQISDIRWIIANCNKCRNNFWIELFKSLNPSPFDVMWIIRECLDFQNIQWFNYLKSLNPSSFNIACIIAEYNTCQTEDWFQYFSSLSPTYFEIKCLCGICEKFKKYMEGRK